MNDTAINLTEVEAVKARSRHLRGTLVESLKDPLTGAIADDDTHVAPEARRATPAGSWQRSL